MRAHVLALVAALLWAVTLGLGLALVHEHLGLLSLPAERWWTLGGVAAAHLGAAAGVHLVVARRPGLALVGLALPVVALGALWLPALGGDPPRPAPAPKESELRPDIALVTVDGLGHRHGVASLEALGAEGVVYTRCLTASPLSLPAHASLLTGKSVREHGITGREGALDGLSVVRTLRTRGYWAGAFLSSHALDRDSGLHKDFHHFDDRWGRVQRWAWNPLLGLGRPRPPVRPGEETTGRALTWAASTPGPRLLWIHLADPADLEDGLSKVVGSLGPEWAVVVLGAHGPAAEGDLPEATLRVPLVVRAPWIRPREVHALTTITRAKEVLLALSGRGVLPRMSRQRVEVCDAEGRCEHRTAQGI